MTALDVMGKEFRYEVCCREIFSERGTLEEKNPTSQERFSYYCLVLLLGAGIILQMHKLRWEKIIRRAWDQT